MNSQVVN